MTPPPDTLNLALELFGQQVIETLTDNAADAFVAGEVRAVKQLGIGLNFSLINSRAVEATKQYRETLVRFGGSDVVEVINGRPTVVFKPWLKDAVESDLNEIGKIINDGVMNGTPLKQVEQALDEVFAMRTHDAKNAAYRETKVLFQKGTMDRFKDEQIRRGIWHHMDPQPNPREEHQERDGKVYDLDDPVWDEQGLWFCKCWCEPVIEGRTVIGNMATVNNTDEGGVWRTIRGTPVFIKDGESVGQAMNRAFSKTGGPDYGGKNIKAEPTKTTTSGGTGGSSSTKVTVKAPTLTKQYGDTPKTAAARLRKESGSDLTLSRNTMAYAKRNIEYTDQKGSWDVKSPERALNEGTGDCSEIAVLTVAMLKSQGIDAQVVHGLTEPGNQNSMHDTVEVTIDGKTTMLEEKEFPKFEKIGNGLHPKERVR